MISSTFTCFYQVLKYLMGQWLTVWKPRHLPKTYRSMTSTVAGKTQYFTNIGGHLVKGPLVSSSVKLPLVISSKPKTHLSFSDQNLSDVCPCWHCWSCLCCCKLFKDSSSFSKPLGQFQANFNKASLCKRDSSLFKEGQCPF